MHSRLSIETDRPHPAYAAPSDADDFFPGSLGGSAVQPEAQRPGIVAFLISAPFIYALAAPLVLLDASVSFYQAVCFRLWRISRAPRRSYVSLARAELDYLNPIQKLNCGYCSYANGVLAYAAEIAARTEQFWCPIKHAKPPPFRHAHYGEFLPYGDGRDLAERTEQVRRRLRAPTSQSGPTTSTGRTRS